MKRADHSGRTNQRKAALKRLGDAQALLESHPPGQHTRGAMYLAGYAVECKLKAIAMEIFDCWTLEQLADKWNVDEREVYTHGLEALVSHFPSYDRFKESSVWRDFTDQVNHWKPSWRYDPSEPTAERAKAFIGAVRRICNWLENNC